MPYSEFTLDKLTADFGIINEIASLFGKEIEKIEPSEHLQMDIEEAVLTPLSSEKAKSEHLITPLLKEVRRRNVDSFTYFSGYSFDVDSKKNLTGICDYLFSQSPRSATINAPVFCIIEAKNKSIEEGYGQCGAEMYAAAIFNEQHNRNEPVIYGAVTTGFEWNFLTLTDKKYLAIEGKRHSIENLPYLLGIFQHIINFYK